MVVRIRLARLSRRHQPLYNIVVSNARKARDSLPLEVLGTYDPTPRTPLAVHSTPEFTLDPVTGEKVEFVPRRYKAVELDLARTKYWLGVGAQPSDGAERLLKMVGLWDQKQ